MGNGNVWRKETGSSLRSSHVPPGTSLSSPVGLRRGPVSLHSSLPHTQKSLAQIHSAILHSVFYLKITTSSSWVGFLGPHPPTYTEEGGRCGGRG